jgi:acetylornithine aminotransferase
MGALSATPNEKYQKPFRPLLPGFAHAKFNDVPGIAQAVDEETCLVLVEPIQGEGGITPCTPAFLEALRKRCDEVGALLCFDEIQCGLARTGKLFAYEHYGVVPDMITLAKPLAAGFPIGAVIASRRVADTLNPGGKHLLIYSWLERYARTAILTNYTQCN